MISEVTLSLRIIGLINGTCCGRTAFADRPIVFGTPAFLLYQYLITVNQKLAITSYIYIYILYLDIRLLNTIQLILP